MILYDISQDQKQAIAAQVRATSPWSPRLDLAQAELVRLDERIAAAAAELEELDSMLSNVGIDSDLSKVAIAKMRQPLVAEHLSKLRIEAAPLRRDIENYEHRIQVIISDKISAARDAVRHAALA
jgi:hypothetical protein